jgi:Cd(II)/Pb(II)-responsive transcriptional regulator
MDSTLMRIGALSQRTGVAVETIRYYERAGLLAPPPRSGANYRLYGPLHVERLRFVRHCRALDMSLDEIRSLCALRATPDVSCGAVDGLLDRHIADIGHRIDELQRLQQQLVALRGCCHAALTVSQCEIMQTLAADALTADSGAKGTDPVRGLSPAMPPPFV